MDVGDRQLMGQIVDVLHALLHLGQLLLKQLRDRAIHTGTPGEEDRGDQKMQRSLNREILHGSVCEPVKSLLSRCWYYGVLFASVCPIV